VGRTDSSDSLRALDVELGEVPGLGGLYARGAGASVRMTVAARVGRGRSALESLALGGPGLGPDRRGLGALPTVAYLARDVRADADRLTAYQHLLGESASDVLPAGFVHVLAFPVAMALMVRPDFPLPLAGLVHVANRVEQRRPVALGDVIDVRAYAEDLRAHRSGTQVDLVTEIRLAGEPADVEPAWRGRSTYLAKGSHLSDAARSLARARSDTSGDGVARGGGLPMPTGQWRLAADVGRRYAAVSGDRNPIHLSALTARAFGFPRAIAHGMYTASRALATVGAARTDAFTWTVAFTSPVLLPGTVTVRVSGDDGAFTFSGWNARTAKVHFTGTVVPH